MASRGICFEFSRTGRCGRRNCRFQHGPGGNQPSTPGENPSKQARGLSSSEQEFRAWKMSIPSGPRTPPLKPASFRAIFTKARKLIELDAGVLQSVIETLAEEDGLRCIQQLVERNFHRLNDSRLEEDVVKWQITPFLETIAHPDVLSSLVLERSLTTIYNFLYGINGDRVVFLLGFICDHISVSSEIGALRLELSLLFFSRIVDLNSTALVQENVHALARRFQKVFSRMEKEPYTRKKEPVKLHQAQKHLERLQNRLEMGNSIPFASSKNPTTPPDTTFPAHLDGPGGRHDNDHSDICKINIMPSYQEILSPRPEYLPVNDPAQWHLPGVEGLLDRNFRLLREDTIGQLRDVVHQVIGPSQHRQTPKRQIRKWVYCGTSLVKFYFDWLAGLQFELKFPQLEVLRKKSALERETWWKTSKRLQSGALVCLVINSQTVVFCTVAQHRMKGKDEDARKDKPDPACLWKDPKDASVVLMPVDPNDENVRAILDIHGLRETSVSLVEFPGVLLPSFKSTLQGLQLMKKSGMGAFSDLLVPRRDEKPDYPMEPPPYSQKVGFAFNLRCLTNNDADLEVPPKGPVDLERLRRDSSLDDAQAAALVNCLQHRIGLIQGPPGTGKSYTGVALIKAIIANKDNGHYLGPIVCVTYTNHALDQLLESLLDNGVTESIVRIGAQSKSERLQKFNIWAMTGDTLKTKMEKEHTWTARREMEEWEQEFQTLKLKFRVTYEQVGDHIRANYPHHHDQLFGNDEEDFQLARVDPKIVLTSWLRSGPKCQSQPRPISDLQWAETNEMFDKERQSLYQHWADEIMQTNNDKAIWISRSQIQSKVRFDNARDEQHLRCISQADVVGMTTTGLAQRQNMLRKLKSKVLLCEEAGEVLESHLLTAFLPSVEHAILIGDHLQLSPQVQNYDLSRQNSRGGSSYSLDVSLFERLVSADGGPMSCGLPYSTLETQRRMHPSISRLVRETLYPNLKDSASVLEYPEVIGLRKRLFWMDHRMPEATSDYDAMSNSHWNDFEVEMTVALVNHLVRQGKYKERDITVLTPYLGQLHRLRGQLAQSFTIAIDERDQEDLEKAGLEDPQDDTQKSAQTNNKVIVKSSLLQILRIATVDNFQGEESKIVVISLVRSNPQNNCGFLRTSNRINVLLSRAQHGMYIIGNSETSKHVPMWAQVIEILRRDNNIGEKLELQCPRHTNTPILVAKPNDFLRLSPEGGCDLRCIKRLACGHACGQKCHSDVLHSVVMCLEPCPRPRKHCDHSCPDVCGRECPTRCMVNVFRKSRKLKCGHLMETLPCWQDQNPSTVKCKASVQRLVPGCNHEMTVPCHTDMDSFACPVQCSQPLPCGHTCKKVCSSCKDSPKGDWKYDHGACQEPCGRNHSTCSHTCEVPCHGEKPCPPCRSQCEVACGHSQCQKLCYEPCTPCAEDRCLSVCPHSACSMPCAAPCDHVPCSQRCEKLLSCWHQCPSVCGEECPPQIFCQICGDEDIRNREVDFILGQLYKEVNLDENPCIFPTCGHFLTMETMDGQMDLKKHYVVSAEDCPKPVAVIAASKPFSMNDVKTCAICRGPLRNIARYGRLVRRAILDESTKKFILALNQEYVPLAMELPQLVQQLQQAPPGTESTWPKSIQINGSRLNQMQAMRTIVQMAQPGRWNHLLGLQRKINQYRERMEPAEQPFQKVRELVIYAQRQKNTTNDFEFESDVLQTKGVLQATVLDLRLHIALLSDFTALPRRAASSGKTVMKLDLQMARDECENLIDNATRHNRRAQQVEGHIFVAQLYVLERPYSVRPTKMLLHQAGQSLAKAKELCKAYPGQTTGLTAEIDDVQRQLNMSVFYATLTSAERMGVIMAMAREFQGTGHWYYCRNGHPFTIGECGNAIESTLCPECGAPVGGHEHQPAEGVTRAMELEEEFGPN